MQRALKQFLPHLVLAMSVAMFVPVCLASAKQIVGDPKTNIPNLKYSYAGGKFLVEDKDGNALIKGPKEVAWVWSTGRNSVTFDLQDEYKLGKVVVESYQYSDGNSMEQVQLSGWAAESGWKEIAAKEGYVRPEKCVGNKIGKLQTITFDGLHDIAQKVTLTFSNPKAGGIISIQKISMWGEFQRKGAPAAKEGAELSMDDLESGIADWKSTEGITVAAEKEQVHSGKGAVRISFTGGMSPRTWEFFWRRFDPARNLADYTHLEFWMRYEGPQPASLTAKYIGYGANDGGAKETDWEMVTALQPGVWRQFRYALSRTPQAGSVAEMRFYARPDWYPAGEKVSFIIDDVRAVRAAKADQPAGAPTARTSISMFPWKPATPQPATDGLSLKPAIPFEFILPDTDMSTRPPLQELTLTACAAERPAVTFAVGAAREIKNARMTASDLQGPNGAIIAASAVDIRVVKVWPQSSRGAWEVKPDGPDFLVPELLVYDDALGFADGFVEDNGLTHYQPPLPIQGPVRTDIPSGTVKQFWITVALGKDIPAGLYRGDLKIQADGLTPRSLPFAVTVLPWVLPAPGKLYGTYYRAYNEPQDPDKSGAPKPESQLMAELREMKEAGIDSIPLGTLPDGDFLSRLREAGMKGPVTFFGRDSAESIKNTAELARRNGYEAYFYGLDEPNSAEKIAKHLQIARAIAAAGGKCAVAIGPDWALWLKDPKAVPYQASPGPVTPLDWAILATTVDDASYQGYVDRFTVGKLPRTAPLQTIYWQFYIENPTCNRLLAGFHLWASGMDGVTPWIYQSFPGISPYNSGDRRNRGGVYAGRTFRAWCVEYPTQGAPIPTLQWEGFRAGVDDVRYLTLLQSEIERARKEGKGEAADGAARAMKEIFAPFLSLPPKNPDGSVMDASLGLYIEPCRLVEARQAVVRALESLR